MKITDITQALIGCLLAAFAFVSWPASATYTLSFSPLTQSITIGNKATVEVRISGILPSPAVTDNGLGNYDFEVVYDPAVIAFDTAADAHALGLAIGLDVIPLQPGTLNLSAFSLEDPADLLAMQSDSMSLFSLVFDSLAPGISLLAFEDITLRDVWGPLGTERTYTTSTGSITVLSGRVHEPATLALLAAAGLLLFGARRHAIRQTIANTLKRECP